MLPSIAFFVTSLLAYARSWQWSHTQGSLFSAAFWTAAALAVLLLAPRRAVMVMGALAVLAALSLKAALLNAEPLGLPVGLAAIGMIVIIYRLSYSSTPPELYDDGDSGNSMQPPSS